MANVFIEPRPKGGGPIENYVIETESSVLHSTPTQEAAIAWAKANGHSPHVARVRKLDNDKRKPDHWRAI